MGSDIGFTVVEMYGLNIGHNNRLQEHSTSIYFIQRAFCLGEYFPEYILQKPYKILVLSYLKNLNFDQFVFVQQKHKFDEFFLISRDVSTGTLCVRTRLAMLIFSGISETIVTIGK